VFEAEHRLADALRDTWQADEAAGHDVPANLPTSAPLIAALWLAAGRVLIVEHRTRATEAPDAAAVATTVEKMGDRLLGYMQENTAEVIELTTTPALDRKRQVS
jgi:hypothetical protein